MAKKQSKTKVISLKSGHEEGFGSNCQIRTEVSDQANCFKDLKFVQIEMNGFTFQTRPELYELSYQIVPENSGQKFQVKNTIFIVVGPHEKADHPDLKIRLINNHDFAIAVLFNPSAIKTLAVVPLKKGSHLDHCYCIEYSSSCMKRGGSDKIDQLIENSKLPLLTLGVAALT